MGQELFFKTLKQIKDNIRLIGNEGKTDVELLYDYIQNNSRDLSREELKEIILDLLYSIRLVNLPRQKEIMKVFIEEIDERLELELNIRNIEGELELWETRILN